MEMGQLWLRGLVIDRSLVWFPWSTCRSAFGQDTELQTSPDVLVRTLHGSHCQQWMNVGTTVSHFGQKHLLNALTCIWCTSLCSSYHNFLFTTWVKNTVYGLVRMAIYWRQIKYLYNLSEALREQRVSPTGCVWRRAMLLQAYKICPKSTTLSSSWRGNSERCNF